MNAEFLFLGTSASAGIPTIGCKCPVCSSSSPYNQRLRPSGLLRVADRTILIDAGPDFRQQALKYKIDSLDGLILTHTHFDHIAGIDELRIFYIRSQKALPCLLSKETHEELKIRYYYFFQSKDKLSLSAKFDFQILEKDFGHTEFLDIAIDYMSYSQGGMKVNGFKIGDFAYVSDIREYDDSIFHSLKGVKTLVLSAIRSEPSHLHLTLDEAVAFARRAGVKKTWLTHVSHSVEHETTNRKLPADIQLGYDGLKILFKYP